MSFAVFIRGQGSLAAATLECCQRYFVCNPPKIASGDILWLCYDTPLDANDVPDNEWVQARIREHVVSLGQDFETLILISSQLPVGTTAKLEQEFPGRIFAHSPENIRVKTAVADFENQARVVVGRRTHLNDTKLSHLFAPFTKNLILTDPETAEMCKHALNCLLATAIVFANEIARICKVVGADAETVSYAMRTDARVGINMPLKPGAPYGGGHLAREVYNLTQIAEKAGVSIPVIAHVRESNDATG